MKKISKKEFLLLSHLRKNARETMTNCSKKTRMPISTIFDKLKKWEQDFLVKHTALIDFARLGYSARVHIMVAVDRERREDFREFLQKDASVNSAYRVNNGFDFIVEAVFADLLEMQEFIEDIEAKFKVTKREVFYVIDDVIREQFLSRPERIEWEVGT